MRNFWSENAPALAAAFLRSDGSLVVELVLRALARHQPPGQLRVLDIGGGDARMALALARLGHAVTVLDPDSTMLAAAERRLSAATPEVRRRLRLVQGVGEEAGALAGDGHDLVCCHSVLMYVDDPRPLLHALVAAARPGGLLSLLSINADACAMRDGLQGRWLDAQASLRSGREAGSRYLPSAEPALRDVVELMAALGAPMTRWYGVGIFTDHLLQAPMADDPRDIIDAEWLAGEQDPYRGVARCYHLVCQRAAA
jgi:S-adenosylmethionine-dependent methyltransferase